MIFNVAQLMKESIGATRVYELAEDIRQIDPELKPLTPLVGTLRFLRTHSGVLVTGELSTALQVSCNRCLEPVVLPARFEIEETFRPLTDVSTGRYIHPDEFEGDSETLFDEALLINEQHLLNLTEVVRQNIWLAIPMYPTCEDAGLAHCLTEEKLDDMGIELRKTPYADAPVSTNRSEAEKEEIDPRWATLLDLHDQFDDEN